VDLGGSDGMRRRLRRRCGAGRADPAGRPTGRASAHDATADRGRRTAHPSPDTRLALAPDATVDARVLVITADGTDAAVDAITHTLRYLGTPFDVLNASTGPALNHDDLVVAGPRSLLRDRARRRAICRAAARAPFTDSEWMTLASYEAQFGVRRAVMYAYPMDAYGLTARGGGFDASATPVTAHCTPAGAGVFVGANCAAPFALDDGWAYGAQASDAATVPLLVDDAGTVYAATRSYPTAARRWC
jgi:hypothetical protein